MRLLPDYKAHLSSDTVIWKVVIGSNSLPNLNSSGVLLLDFCVSHSLLKAVPSLYDWSRSLIYIAGSKSDMFPVHARF